MNRYYLTVDIGGFVEVRKILISLLCGMIVRFQVLRFRTHMHSSEDDEGDGRTGIWMGGDEYESVTSITTIRWSPKLHLGAIIMIIQTLSQIKACNFMNLERF